MFSRRNDDGEDDDTTFPLPPPGVAISAEDRKTLAETIEINEKALCEADFLYGCYSSRDPTQLCMFLASYRDVFYETFELDLANPEDTSFRDLADEVFGCIGVKTPEARIAQLFLVLLAIRTEGDVKNFLCPPTGTARVHRPAFIAFQPVLAAFSENLDNGTRMTLPRYVEELALMYTILLPANAADIRH